MRLEAGEDPFVTPEIVFTTHLLLPGQTLSKSGDVSPQPTGPVALLRWLWTQKSCSLLYSLSGGRGDEEE